MLSLAGVVKNRAKLTIGPIDVVIPKGTLTVIAGKNGKGKSTVLKMIAGILEPNQGKVLIDEAYPYEYKQRKAIAYMPDVIPFNETKTLYEIEQWLPERFPDFDAKACIEMMEYLGAPRFTDVGKLSKGEQKCVQFAIANSCGADIYLLDEPTLGLDTKRKERMLSTIQTWLLDETKTVIVCSNNIEDFELICDQILYLQEGQMVFYDTPDAMRQKYRLWQGAEVDFPTKGVVKQWQNKYNIEALIDCSEGDADNTEVLSLGQIMHYLERRQR